MLSRKLFCRYIFYGNILLANGIMSNLPALFLPALLLYSLGLFSHSLPPPSTSPPPFELVRIINFVICLTGQQNKVLLDQMIKPSGKWMCSWELGYMTIKKSFFFFLKKVYVKDKEQTQGKAFTCSAWFQGLGPSATFLDIAMMI